MTALEHRAPERPAVTGWRRLLRALNRHVMLLGLVVAVGWLATVVVLIATTPPGGEASPQHLAAALRNALADADPDAVRGLLANPPADHDIDAALRVGSCTAAAPTVTVTEHRGRLMLELRTSVGICGRLPIADHGGRWLIDPWAAPLQ